VSADDFRLLTIVLTLAACLLVPAAIYRRVRTPAVLLIVVVLILQYIGASLAVADTEGHPMVWYRTPRIFVAAVVSLVYVAVAFRLPPGRD